MCVILFISQLAMILLWLVLYIKLIRRMSLGKLFAVRMEQFGQLAIQMNDALKVQKNWRNEKDSAAKNADCLKIK